MLFVGPHNNKGKVLATFFQETRLTPRKLVFFDDKVRHVANLEKVFMGNPSIDYTGFRYGAMDEWVKSFDEKLANAQHQIFLQSGHLASDTEASAGLPSALTLECSSPGADIAAVSISTHATGVYEVRVTYDLDVPGGGRGSYTYAAEGQHDDLGAKLSLKNTPGQLEAQPYARNWILKGTLGAHSVSMYCQHH